MAPEFWQLEASVLQAVVDRDWDGLGRLLDDQFAITTAGWLERPATKEEWIGEVAAHHNVHRFEIHTVDVHQMDLAVTAVLVLSTQWATWKGAPFQGDFRYTDVWRADADDHWRLAIRHASLVPPS